MKKPARGPVSFCNRRSGSKIAKAITWQPEPERQPGQPGQPGQQQERPERQQQEPGQQPERPVQQPGLLFCHRR
jgi:hypothetical protein